MGWVHYRDLIVWQKAMDLVDELYQLLGFLPREESYALAVQMRRAVISIPSNIAEGHGRQTEKEFKQFLSIARGSLYEVLFMSWRHSCISVYANSIFPSCRPKKL